MGAKQSRIKQLRLSSLCASLFCTEFEMLKLSVRIEIGDLCADMGAESVASLDDWGRFGPLHGKSQPLVACMMHRKRVLCSLSRCHSCAVAAILVHSAYGYICVTSTWLLGRIYVFQHLHHFLIFAPCSPLPRPAYTCSSHSDITSSLLSAFPRPYSSLPTSTHPAPAQTLVP